MTVFTTFTILGAKYVHIKFLLVLSINKSHYISVLHREIYQIYGKHIFHLHPSLTLGEKKSC